MKNLFNLLGTLFLLIFYALPAYPQTIRGVVFDSVTAQPVPFASIYYNGTGQGISANVHGEFELKISDQGLIPIAISAIGYHSLLISAYTPDRFITARLLPKVYEIRAVKVKADKESRTRKEAEFKRQFLGQTTNGYRCFIQNIRDIMLVVDTNKTLHAFCDKPLIIENKALRYKITYYLNQFQDSNDSLTYSGTYYFVDLDTDKIPNRILKRRDFTYLGSRMHFIRALWANTLIEDGFYMRMSDVGNIDYHDIVVDTGKAMKFLHCNEPVSVYYPRFGEKSVFKLIRNKVEIDKSGYFDPHGIHWEGSMAIDRIADLLPFEYIPFKK